MNIKQLGWLTVLWCSIVLAACDSHRDAVHALPFQETSHGGWGLVATNGEIRVAANTYKQRPSAVVNGLFTLPTDSNTVRLYHIDHPQQPVTPQAFARIGHFFEEVAPAQETLRSPIILIDRKGQIVASTAQYPQYDITLVHNFSEGLALIATREGKYGYMNLQGTIVIPPIYDIAYDFHEGMALVGMANKEGYIGFQSIDKAGNIYQSIQINGCLFGQGYSNGLLLFKNIENGHCGYLDGKGKTIIYLPAEVEEVYPFRFGQALFQATNGMGLLNNKGEVTIAPSYEDIIPLSKERVALRNNGRWALAESGGKTLSDFCYDHLGAYYDTGVLVASQGDSCLLLDKQGQMAGNRRFVCIVEEATARRQMPQLFIRETPQEKPQAKPKSSATPAPRPKKSSSAPTLQSSINRESWKEIGKQNPFYNEASKVFSGNLEEKDADNRRIILNYVEHLRTSYTTKDIDFLEQLFSENALIVVGTVVRSAPKVETDYLPRAQVVYNVKSKQQYITRLKQVFKANKQIEVTFSNFRIMRHPTKEGIYGVTLQQRYRSDIYSDDGYLFLLWDFRDETAPKIHVRTWQPAMLDERIHIPEEAIFNISNFNLQ